MGKVLKTDGGSGATVIDSRLAAFVAELPVAVAIFDHDMRYISWSRPWTERYGTGERNLEGECHYDIFPNVTERFKEAHRRALAGEVVQLVGDRVEHLDGHVTWERWSIKPIFNDDGETDGIAIFTEDITGPKLAESHPRDGDYRLRQTLEILGIGVVEMDFSTHEYLANDTFCRLIGLQRDEFPRRSEDWIAILNPVDLDSYRSNREDAYNPAIRRTVDTELRPSANGVVRNVRLCGHVVFSDDSDDAKPERFIGIMIDDTQNRAMQTSLEKVQRLETVGRIAGIIAHDFNNLLSVILANVELAALRVSDPSIVELLQRAQNAAEVGGSFNRRLLALSSQKEISPTPVSLDARILKTWAMFEHLLTEEVSFRFVPGADNLCVLIDPAELDGAILNLVINARDSQPRGGSIVIATRDVEIDSDKAQTLAEGKTGRFIELSITDEGIGMSKEDIHDAQEPFFTKKPPGMGTGLGLTSVAATVTRSGGFMSIESEPGEGTRVSLFLPVAKCTSQHDPHEEDMPFGNGELVLVVEDEDMLREATLKRLEALGYAVLEAASAESALELLAEGEPVDLVFSDVVMPGDMTGFDLADEVQRSFPEVAILLTSGYISGSKRSKDSDASHPELLNKPYTLAVLAKAVHRNLNSHFGRA